MEQRIKFTGKNEISLESFELTALESNQVAVRTIHSIISTGTELTVLHRNFEAGTNWERWIKYPFYPGYAAIGEVTQIGSAVTTLKCGDRVACRTSHASAFVSAVDQCHLVPDGIPSDQAAWFAFAKIAAMGARAANHGLGTSVVVIGAGPIGQMAARWALAAGARPVMLVDTVQLRLDLACRNGAITPICAPIGEALQAIKDANNGQLADVVIDSTGNAAIFEIAQAATAYRGRFVVLGSTGKPSEMRFPRDFLVRGLTVIAAHDGHEDAAWNSQKIIPHFFKLHQSGAFGLDGMNTHHFKPAACIEAYATATEHRTETMGIVFDWNS